MPGLIRGVARTAVVAGTATAVSNRVSRRQADRWAQQGDPNYGYGYGQPEPQPPAYAPPPPAPAAEEGDPIERLKELGQLREQGVLTDAEFASEKAKILSRT